ncbi:MAG TPA: dihydrodipicolinate synthase family protein [Acidobacteriaceae bacterium]|nr:dihydrodipicolinate synthase family protein [Acidobacteriaceae bacterium]
MLLEGIFPPITTCFYPDGRPYWRKLEHNVERYSRTQISGLVVLGSTGEAVMLSDDESREVLRIAREAAAAEKVLIAGVGCESVIETLRLAERAADLNYDAIMVRTPHFYRGQMGELELITFYQAVADRSAAPVLLYSVPAYTAYELPVSVIGELSAHPNIIGMKDSGGGTERVAEIVEATRRRNKVTVTVTSTFTAVTGRMKKEASAGAQFASTLIAASQLEAGGTAAATAQIEAATRPAWRTREVGFQLLNSRAQSLYDALEAGATGSVSATAAFAPQAVHEIFTAWKDKDCALARDKERRVATAENEICKVMGVPGVKCALDWNGYFGGRPRMPLLPLTASRQGRVEELLADLRN